MLILSGKPYLLLDSRLICVPSDAPTLRMKHVLHRTRIPYWRLIHAGSRVGVDAMAFNGARFVPGELTVRFNQENRTLWTDDGRFLKQLDCPLHKRWSEMKPVEGDERRRICGSCSKAVVSLEGATDAEARELIGSKRDTCVMIPFGAANVTIHGKAPRLMSGFAEACPLRVIRTARGLVEIRGQTTPKLRPFVVDVPETEGIQMSVWQHQKTGEVDITGDMRYGPTTGCLAKDRPHWKMIIGWYRYSQGHRTGSDHIPIAAYMIPSDLKPRELVFVEDIIEIVVSSVNISQGGVSAYRSATAVWTGNGFEFCVPPPSECIG